MRVRVRFRFRADTGEVEMFQVDDVDGGLPGTDHDARHDRAAADVARVIDANPLVEEVAPDAEAARPGERRIGDRATAEDPSAGRPTGEDRLLRG